MSRVREPYYPQATREDFKNHPTHDHDIEPTNDGHMGRAIGHPWGALGCSAAKGKGSAEKETGNGASPSETIYKERCTCIRAENDEAPWLVRWTTQHRLAVWGQRGCRWKNSGKTRSALRERSCKAARNRFDCLRGAAYNGSDGRLGGWTAVTTLSIWLERTDARVGLLRERNLEDGHRGWNLRSGRGSRLKEQTGIDLRTGCAPQWSGLRIEGDAR